MIGWSKPRTDDAGDAHAACEREAARRKKAEDRTWANAFILLRRAHQRRLERKARAQLEYLSTRRDPPR